MQPNDRRLVTEAALAQALLAYKPAFSAELGSVVPPGTTNWFGPYGLSGSQVTTLGPYDVSASRQGTLIAVPKQVTVDQVGVQVTTAQAGVNVKVALYLVGDDGLPAGAPYVSPAISCAATGSITATVNWALAPGTYLGFLVTDTTSAGTVRFGGYTQSTALGSVASSMAQIYTNAVGVPRFTITSYATPQSDPVATVGSQPAGTVPIIGLRRAA